MDVCFALFLMTMLLTAQSSDALDCYTCTDPPSCNAPTTRTCAAGFDQCLRWVGNTGSSIKIISECGRLTEPGDGCHDDYDLRGEKGRVCACTTDLCNSEANFVPSNAFSCYECSDSLSDGLAPCDHPTHDTCPPPDGWCFTVKSDDGTGVKTVRACAQWPAGNTGCSDNFLFRGRIGRRCTCKTDLCNTEENFVPAFVCYQCSDPPQNGLVSCDHPINYTCPEDYDSCIKWDGNSGTGIKTIKDCVKSTNKDPGCTDNYLLNGKKGKGCTCTTNLCNNSPGSVTLSNTFTLFSTVAALLMIICRL